MRELSSLLFSTDSLLRNSSSFIYGRNPQKYSVPVYALIEVCQPTQKNFFNFNNNLTKNEKIKKNSNINFHVTYWMFYPFSQGKAICTFNMGRFGAWPIPRVNDICLGDIKVFGNHVGDWEHISLYFEVNYHFFFFLMLAHLLRIKR